MLRACLALDPAISTPLIGSGPVDLDVELSLLETQSRPMQPPDRTEYRPAHHGIDGDEKEQSQAQDPRGVADE